MRGDKGVCYGEKRDLAKEFLEVRFLGFSDCFYFKWLCLYVTHPRPSQEGRLDAAFLLKMSDLWHGVSPLERGPRGVLR